MHCYDLNDRSILVLSSVIYAMTLQWLMTRNEFYRLRSMSNVHLVFSIDIVYPKKYAHGFCFAVLCCGYTSTDFPISIRHTSLALWQSNDCPSANKATLMNMDKYFMCIHYERLHNTAKQSTTKPCAYFLGYTVCQTSSSPWKQEQLAI